MAGPTPLRGDAGVIIPIVTMGILMAYSFHPSNMVAHAASTPKSGMFTAVATAGIVFSFLGFQQAIALAGEMIGFFTGMWIIATFSLIILWLALAAGQDAQAVQKCADRVKTLGSCGAESPRQQPALEPAPCARGRMSLKSKSRCQSWIPPYNTALLQPAHSAPFV